jgi:hypothetical protein
VSEEAKRSRIQDKIAASQARLRGDQPVPPPRRNLPDGYPPENYRSLAAEYPVLTVVGGLALGALAASLLPKSTGSKVGRRLLSTAALAAELGLALSKHAGRAAQSAGREGLHKLDGGTADMRHRAGRAIGSARSAGLSLAREAAQRAIGKRR